MLTPAGRLLKASKWQTRLSDLREIKGRAPPRQPEAKRGDEEQKREEEGGRGNNRKPRLRITVIDTELYLRKKRGKRRREGGRGEGRTKITDLIRRSARTVANFSQNVASVVYVGNTHHERKSVPYMVYTTQSDVLATDRTALLLACTLSPFAPSSYGRAAGWHRRWIWSIG